MDYSPTPWVGKRYFSLHNRELQILFLRKNHFFSELGWMQEPYFRYIFVSSKFLIFLKKKSYFLWTFYVHFFLMHTIFYLFFHKIPSIFSPLQKKHFLAKICFAPPPPLSGHVYLYAKMYLFVFAPLALCIVSTWRLTSYDRRRSDVLTSTLSHTHTFTNTQTYTHTYAYTISKQLEKQVAKKYHF